MVLRNELEKFWREEHAKHGYQEIRTPIILNRALWERSGHWDHYKNNMYFTKIDDEDYAIKPMNCPGGVLVYKSKPHSYKELPLRLGELGIVHRHELSGVLHGLMRVRCFTQDDAHIFMKMCIRDRSKATWQPGRKKQHARSGRLDRGRCGYPYHRPWLIPAFVLICRQSQGSLQRRE